MSGTETEKSGGPPLRLVLVGLQGVGKSAAGNTILGREEFRSDISSTALTLKSELKQASVHGRSVEVVDTPGLFNTVLSDAEMKREMDAALTLCQPGPHAFLVVIQLGRFTELERQVMDELSAWLGAGVSAYSIVLFTYGDKLKNKTIGQFVQEDRNLQRLVGRCGGQYHVFDNVHTEDKSQVAGLLDKIDAQLKKRRRRSVYIKSTKQWPDSWTMIVYIILPIASFIAFMAYRQLSLDAPVQDVVTSEVTEKVLEVTEKVLEVTEKVLEVTEKVPDQAEELLDKNTAIWEMLMDKWRVMIPLAVGIGAGLWILRKLRK